VPLDQQCRVGEPPSEAESGLAASAGKQLRGECLRHCHVYDIVRLQYVELRSALSGRGNYVLVPAFSRHSVPYQTQATAAPEKKDAIDIVHSTTDIVNFILYSPPDAEHKTHV